MLHKRLDYGFSGYHVPFFPKAARSARRRGPLPNDQLRAFDVLATVAGKLLQAGSYEDLCSGKNQDVNVENTVINEQNNDGYPLKLDCHDQESVGIPSQPLELGLQDEAAHCSLNEAQSPQHDIYLSSLTSDCLEKDNVPDRMHLLTDKGNLCCNSGKRDECYPVHLKCCLPDINDFVQQHSSENFRTFSRNSAAVVTTDSGVKVPSLSASRCNKVDLFSKEDDGNSCIQPRTVTSIKSRTRIGDRRIRKLLASKYWRVAPRLKNGGHYDTELRHLYQRKKYGYKRQRSQRIYPFKKRRFFNCSSLSSSDVEIGCKGVYSSSKKVNDLTALSFGAVGQGVGQSAAIPCRESHVKLRIKSFRVPEFFIEMPETATIGSLKRTILEALTALLGGGMHIGVLLQGKKIRDDNKTLLQSGISHDDKVESVGFTLEPDPSEKSKPVSSENNLLVLPTDVMEPIFSCPSSSTISQKASHVSSHNPVNNRGKPIESDHNLTPFAVKILAEKGTADSRELVNLFEGVPPVLTVVQKGTADSRELVNLFEGAPQVLTVVPANQKSKSSEIGPRRIRRPFSVAEVEALVQAVEKLGTGRWRDVKMQAFDSVKHRTYVDLKDKWKTLVHTARISPQQRRGEAVPQELLDRVLAAHAYWSRHQHP